MTDHPEANAMVREERKLTRRNALKTLGGITAGVAGLTTLSGSVTATGDPSHINVDIYLADSADILGVGGKIDDIISGAENFCNFLSGGCDFNASTWDETDQGGMGTAPSQGDDDGWASFSDSLPFSGSENAYRLVILNTLDHHLGRNVHDFEDSDVPGGIGYVNIHDFSGGIRSILEPIAAHELLHSVDVEHEHGTYDTDKDSWTYHPSVMGAGYTRDADGFFNEPPAEDWQGDPWQQRALGVSYTSKISRDTVRQVVRYLDNANYPDEYWDWEDYYDLTSY